MVLLQLHDIRSCLAKNEKWNLSKRKSQLTRATEQIWISVLRCELNLSLISQSVDKQSTRGQLFYPALITELVLPQLHIKYKKSRRFAKNENRNLPERKSKFEFQFASCSEQTVNENTDIAAEYYKVVRKRTSCLTVNNLIKTKKPRVLHGLNIFFFRRRVTKDVSKHLTCLIHVIGKGSAFRRLFFFL